MNSFGEDGLRCLASLRKEMAAQKQHIRAAPLSQYLQQVAEESGHEHLIIARCVICAI